MRWLDRTRGLRFADYAALWRWSTTDVPGFWSAVWDYCGLDACSTHDEVLADASMPGASWFPGARLNFAERCFAQSSEERPALISLHEGGVPVETPGRSWDARSRRWPPRCAGWEWSPATRSPAICRTPRTP
ncbi:acetyl-coenzyme A synthetase N-terminal domain-containing protein [Streptomyces sp. NPDC056663]|uniref:acetyl-coenzyme A synthetase N-terminal domain-containing protein n=1 Tax=Streptomyces sp. NPDC056663 TaxID=3345899 RepID=UPI0036CB656D